MIAFYVSLIVPVFSWIVLLLFQLPKEMKIEEANLIGKNKWQRLTKKGKRFVIVSFWGMVLVELGLIANWPKPLSSSLAPTPKTQIVEIPKIVHDTTTKERVVEKIINPVMDFVLDSTTMIGSFPKFAEFRAGMICINDGIAFRIRTQLSTYNIINDTVVPIGGIQHNANTSMVASIKYNPKIIFTSIPIIFPNNASDIKSYYICFVFCKVIYSNKAVNGSDQEPLRGIFYVKIASYPKSLNDISVGQVREFQDYLKLKNYLIKHKVW